MSHSTLVDPKGRAYTPLAIVDVLYYRRWHRGRLLKIGRKRLVVDITEGSGGRERPSIRHTHQVYVVRG